MTRPVKHYQRPTLVSLEVLLYAILDVVSVCVCEFSRPRSCKQTLPAWLWRSWGPDVCDHCLFSGIKHKHWHRKEESCLFFQHVIGKHTSVQMLRTE